MSSYLNFFQVEDAFVFHDASIAKGEGLVFIGMKCHLCVFVEVTGAAVFCCLKCFQKSNLRSVLIDVIDEAIAFKEAISEHPFNDCIAALGRSFGMVIKLDPPSNLRREIVLREGVGTLVLSSCEDPKRSPLPETSILDFSA